MILGLILGSFYTALASRVLYYFYGPGRKREDPWREFFTRPSFCMSCGKRVGPADLVPVLSYLILKGRCRHCNTPYGIKTLLGELMPGVLFPLMIYSGAGWIETLFTVLFAGQLYLSMSTDLRLLLLDYENTLFLYLWGVSAALMSSHMEWEYFRFHLLSGAGLSLLFFLLYLAGGGKKMGGGDILLVGALGVQSGLPWSLLILEFGSMGVILYLGIYRKNWRAPAPFGFFLSLGAILALFAEAIWKIYRTGGYPI